MIVEKSTAVPSLVTGIDPADINTVATTLDGSVLKATSVDGTALKATSVPGSALTLKSVDYPQISNAL